MKKYLLNVTFYAGSNAEEDTDKGLFLLCVDRKISEKEIIDIFQEVNKLLSDYDEDELDAKGANFPISYGMGLNINLLMEGIKIYTKGEIKELHHNQGEIKNIDNYYVIEQWS